MVAIACAITFVITVTVATKMFNQLIGGVVQREEIYSKIQEIDSYVRNAEYYDINEEILIDSIVNGYVSGLNDVNAEYLTETQANKKRQKELGNLISSGLELGKEESGYLKVEKIYTNSPAEKADIKLGDIVTAINGKDVLETGFDAVIGELDGDENTNLQLTVQRSGENKEITITRKSFTVQSVTSQTVSGYGYIRIEYFNSLTGKQFVSQLQNLKANGVLGYVIDVRNCDGVYDGLAEILTEFVSSSLMANAQYKNGTVAKFLETTEAADPITAPVVVLTNENTAGPAELLAVSLKDFASSKIVGKQTAGKATVTELKNLSDGSAIVITAAEILPTGATSLKNGIKVDFSVELTENPDYAPSSFETSDSQLKKAFEVVESM